MHRRERTTELGLGWWIYKRQNCKHTVTWVILPQPCWSYCFFILPCDFCSFCLASSPALYSFSLRPLFIRFWVGSSGKQPSCKTASGPCTLWPNTTSLGLNPVLSWTTSRAAHSNHGNPSSQSPDSSVQKARNRLQHMGETFKRTLTLCMVCCWSVMLYV